MMNAAELLSLATARPPNWTTPPGGIPVLTQQDVMYALACIRHDGAALLLRVKFADQQTYIGELEQEVFKAVQELWKSKKWPQPKSKSNFLLNLSRLAIIEHLRAHTCPRCGGWGNDIKHGKIIPCETCNGMGKKKFTDEDRAKIMEMRRTTWRDWDGNYHYIQAFLWEWESLGIGRATAKLRG